MPSLQAVGSVKLSLALSFEVSVTERMLKVERCYHYRVCLAVGRWLLLSEDVQLSEFFKVYTIQVGSKKAF